MKEKPVLYKSMNCFLYDRNLRHEVDNNVIALSEFHERVHFSAHVCAVWIFFQWS